MSLGEDRVRTKFNPSSDSVVDQIKRRTADLIDNCAGLNRGSNNPEEKRLWDLAMTAYEEAAMWAIKAATISS